MSGSLASRLFEQHGRAVRRYLHRHLRESATAEDLCQEVFLRVVRAADDYQARERDRAWVFRIARNVLALGCGSQPGVVAATDGSVIGFFPVTDLAIKVLQRAACPKLLAGVGDQQLGLSTRETAERVA